MLNKEKCETQQVSSLKQKSWVESVKTYLKIKQLLYFRVTKRYMTKCSNFYINRSFWLTLGSCQHSFSSVAYEKELNRWDFSGSSRQTLLCICNEINDLSLILKCHFKLCSLFPTFEFEGICAPKCQQNFLAFLPCCCTQPWLADVL